MTEEKKPREENKGSSEDETTESSMYEGWIPPEDPGPPPSYKDQRARYAKITTPGGPVDTKYEEELIKEANKEAKNPNSSEEE